MMGNSEVNALVTGASRGIGKSIVQALLQEGNRVIGTARSSVFPATFAKHKNFEGLHVDLARTEQMRTLLKPVFDREKAPMVLINNAGISEDADMSAGDDRWLQTWDRTMQVNLRAPALLSKWALNRWQREGMNTGEGILINIASRAAYRGDTQEFASYAASKGGLVAFTKSVARDFGEHGISAYSIAPGFTQTDMVSDSTEIYGEKYLTQGMSFDQITSPEEVGELVAFLASGKVPHMTGSTFHINGGSYMI
ncbi:NAD(P)-dependent dehydrogenase, short-chain alcohol dehydrogenase family [Fodinibius roseus]|uniref:NAD(P)-dependent dehydrogenase, short-chain alcohol dehydrogenase family n=1 Tax=Fodinibius roseus TaxID=1194090 RepID=A0A1M5CB75_9BACT|nr:SDR family oxidoreductase [Fodinibius roseus]SHF51950.1 NAD(P)-dependent dehydrogenase, short-chain alcohol dehydrogenase family [Fodinibius roseus]